MVYCYIARVSLTVKKKKMKTSCAQQKTHRGNGAFLIGLIISLLCREAMP